MRYIFAICVLVFATSANALMPAPAHEQPPRTISVVGNAEVKAVPDQVIISMTVENMGKQLVATKRENDRTVSGVIRYITRNAGVDEKHVQTNFVTITPQYKHCNYNTNISCKPYEVTHYRVRKGIKIRLNDLDKYENIIAKALELGVTNIEDMRFTTTKLREHKDKAREMAAKAALEKARAVASVLGAEVAEPISVNVDNSDTHYSPVGMLAQNAVMSVNSASASSAGNFALGQISISAQVSVTFAIK